LNATNSLFQHRWIPIQVIKNDPAAVPMKVNTFLGFRRGNQYEMDYSAMRNFSMIFVLRLSNQILQPVANRPSPAQRRLAATKPESLLQFLPIFSPPLPNRGDVPTPLGQSMLWVITFSTACASTCERSRNVSTAINPSAKMRSVPFS